MRTAVTIWMHRVRRAPHCVRCDRRSGSGRALGGVLSSAESWAVRDAAPTPRLPAQAARSAHRCAPGTRSTRCRQPRASRHLSHHAPLVTGSPGADHCEPRRGAALRTRQRLAAMVLRIRRPARGSTTRTRTTRCVTRSCSRSPRASLTLRDGTLAWYHSFPGRYSDSRSANFAAPRPRHAGSDCVALTPKAPRGAAPRAYSGRAPQVVCRR